MRKALTIAGLSLLKSRKDKTWIIAITVMALFITFIIGLCFGNSEGTGPSTVPISFTDYDNSEVSEKLIDDLNESGAYNALTRSEEEVISDVRDGKVEVGFIIPEGFGSRLTSDKPKSIEVVSLGTSQAAIAVQSLMENSLADWVLADAVKNTTAEKAQQLKVEGIDVNSLATEVSHKLRENPPLETQYETLVTRPQAEEDGDSGFSEIAIGMVIQFTMFTVIFSAGEILDERKNRTWSRLLSTPTSRASILGGKVLGAYVIGVIQIAILIVGGQYLLGINYGSNLLGVAVVMGVFLLAVTGLGLLMATLVRTSAQLGAITPIVIVSTCMLGGCFWPLDVVPGFMQVLAKFTPQAWVMEAMKDVVIRGKDIMAAGNSLLMLCLFALVFFVAGVTQVKYE